MHRRQLLAGLLATVGLNAVMVPPGRSGTVSGNVLPLKRGRVGNLPPVDRDQGMGATDGAGFVAHFPLRAIGAQQVWVDTVGGMPSYNGLSPYPGYQMNGSGPNHQLGATGRGAPNHSFGPRNNFADALNGVVPAPHGEGNQFFFAEGQKFIIDALHRGMLYYHGISARYPACFQSYDPKDPLNVARHGRAGTGSQGARPIWQLGTGTWPGNSRGDAVDYGGWVFRGLEWRSEGNGQASQWVYCQHDMLFENIVFDNVALVLSNNDPQPGFGIGENNIVRLCASYGQYDTHGSHICGIYSENSNLTVEDSIFWHCGWKVGVSRDAPVSAGGPDIFKHCLYLHNGKGTSSLLRRNVLIDGSASGLSLRGSHLCHHNVIIDCPTPDFVSGGSGSDAESPNGVVQQTYCQLVIGGADINSSLPRMQGFASGDGTPDSFYAYCLYANNPGYGRVNNCWLQVQNGIPGQISHMGFYHNRAYAFAPPPRRLMLSAHDRGSVSSIRITGDIDNVLATTSPMTNAQLYAAVGFRGKAAMVAAMIADPSQKWAYRLLGAAATGFNFNFNYTMA